MATLEGLKRKIDGIEDLGSVVKTMKALAAVNIRQFEKAAVALQMYDRTVDMALQIVLRDRPGFSISARAADPKGLLAVVFGTDQGMCGPLNETIVAHTLKAVDHLGVDPGKLGMVAVGIRAANRLADEGRPVAKTVAVPGTVDAVTSLVQELVVEIEQSLEQDGLERVDLFHCRPQSKATYRPHTVRLLPVDRQWLRTIREKPWPGNQLPWYSMPWDPLFAALIRQYLFAALYRAAVESLVAENASRLAAMQGAESSIEERLEALQGQYHRQRQMGITEELLDIVSGFQALEADRVPGDRVRE